MNEHWHLSTCLPGDRLFLWTDLRHSRQRLPLEMLKLRFATSRNEWLKFHYIKRWQQRTPWTDILRYAWARPSWHLRTERYTGWLYGKELNDRLLYHQARTLRQEKHRHSAEHLPFDDRRGEEVLKCGEGHSDRLWRWKRCTETGSIQRREIEEGKVTQSSVKCQDELKQLGKHIMHLFGEVFNGVVEIWHGVRVFRLWQYFSTLCTVLMYYASYMMAVITKPGKNSDQSKCMECVCCLNLEMLYAPPISVNNSH